MTVGAMLKLGTNFTLVSRPELNIQGVPYGSLLCYGFIVLVSAAYLRGRVGVRLRLFQVAGKPLFCAALCGGGAYSAYYLLFSSFSSSVRLLASIACGGLIYLAALLLTGAILKSDLEMLPNNEKIAKTLEKLGLIG